ncbi:MAG: hypothetical protein OD918_07295 [Gammaproteobacteria bacterium]
MKKTEKSRAHNGAKNRRKSPGAMRRPSEPGGLSFADAFLDVFTWPDLLPRHRPSILPGPVIDAMHIRGYFRKAVGDLGRDEAGAKKGESR